MGSLLFLSSGLFLGWTLGANDASNVFGSAVGSRMLRFSTAAVLCSVFVIIGAVTAGAGASGGLGELGAVNALAGSFTTALAAAATMTWMTRAGLPASTTQAVVGAIVGWNWFSGSITDLSQLSRIVATWVLSPLLAALFAAGLYRLVVAGIRRTRPHLLRLDANLRVGLILAGVFGSYSLGANNIGNVMGVFVPASPFQELSIAGLVRLSGEEQLFLLGAIAIAVGVFTYSRRVMTTVGGSLMTLSPLAALVVVVANALVLFVFSSRQLSAFVVALGLPPIPLIPVSSSQAVIGAVLGIGLLQGARGVRQIRWDVLGRIASGWLTTPVIAALVSFVLLFVVQNVFGQQVYRPVAYQLSPPALVRLAQVGIPTEALAMDREPVQGAVRFRGWLRRQVRLDPAEEALVLRIAEIRPVSIHAEGLRALEDTPLSPAYRVAVAALQGRSFLHPWQLAEALARQSPLWSLPSAAPVAAVKRQEAQLALVLDTFTAAPEAAGRLPPSPPSLASPQAEG
ncbi:inorganic phosphate transporter [Cyanobium sp. ATX 6A2]|uniref:inorganic phosphate transporter n=1 Tax=Cyanobium sp. ATX 6A2 TaxID=2823700 RepID=UPI0020CC04F7|nr:inorganic phosphate transporter [Cyanobium sp. ATX 6A2]